MLVPVPTLQIPNNQGDSLNVRPRSWATPADWANFRDVITELYSYNTLARTMKIMEQSCGFRATWVPDILIQDLLIKNSERMYKSRVQQWGLDKKYKGPETRVTTRKSEGHEALSKGSTFRIRFRIRGQWVEYDEAIRFFNQKGVPVDDIVVQDARPWTREYMECFTQMSTSVRKPEKLAVPERIFRVLCDYYEESFTTGKWNSRNPESRCQTTKTSDDVFSLLRDLRSKYILACDLFNHNHAQEGGQAIRGAFAMMDEIILAEHPHNFETLAQIVMNCHLKGRPELAAATFRHLSGLGKRCLRENHPFGLICGWLSSMHKFDQSYVQEVLCQLLRATYESFQRRLGPHHRSTIEAHLAYIHWPSEINKDSRFELLALKQLLGDCEHFLPRHNLQTLHVRLRLAYAYRYWKDNVAASKEAEVALANVACHGEFRLNALETLARSYRGLNKLEMSEQILKQAIDLSSSIHGLEYAWTQKLMLQLEEWLTERIAREEAEVVRLRECLLSSR